MDQPEQDPDYSNPSEPEFSNRSHQQQLLEENARTTTKNKITEIIEKEFGKEINSKEKEILQIQSRLHKALKTLHLLRYAVINNYYSNSRLQPPSQDRTQQTHIHPAVKEIIGKTPKYSYYPSQNDNNEASTSRASEATTVEQSNEEATKNVSEENQSRRKRPLEESQEKEKPVVARKVPRYIPPKNHIPETDPKGRGTRLKCRKRIIVGNISKWIPPDWRDDETSHKWTMYVRGDKEEADISEFVDKVRFFLHPSYKPNDIVEVTSCPFHLSRRGWGEFPLRVQLHFKNPLNKPLDIIHHLKLDRTYTGLQTLGSETVVDIWIQLSNSTGDCQEPVDFEDLYATINNANTTRTDNFNDIEASIVPKIKHEPAGGVNLSNESHNNKQNHLTNGTHSPAKKCKSEALVTRTINHEDNLVHSKFKEKQVNNSSKAISNGHISLDHCYANIWGANANERDTVGVDGDGDTNDECATKLDNATTNINTLESNQSLLKPLNIIIPSNFPVVKQQQQKHVLILNEKEVPLNSIKLADNEAKSKIASVSLLKSSFAANHEKSTSQSAAKVIKINTKNSVLLNPPVNGSSVPALMIANRSTASIPPGSTRMEYSEAELNKKIVKEKVSIAKNKFNITSRKSIYDATLQSIEDVEITDIECLIKFIAKKLPIITTNAADPEYKAMHLYACVNENEFFGHSVGKQKAFEWHRAKTIRSYLLNKGIDEDQCWSVKEIMIWAKRHGYSPSIPKALNSLPSSSQESDSKSLVTSDADEKEKADEFCSYSESQELQDWLSDVRDCKRSASNHRRVENDNAADSDVDIDVVEIDDHKTNHKSVNKGSSTCTTDPGKSITLDVPEKLEALHIFANSMAKQIGVKLGPEEIVPGVFHYSATRVIVQAVECLAEELTRASLANAWERNNRHPDSITPIDVKNALASREEFDIFTNSGLTSLHAQVHNDDF